ncbi:hypothetical protein R1sor_026415 [Riccia sorocarpa]|uniref:beta-glucosidase n=1 Tax=Riccia sorocarpa TaxID=122646 RepID=A0ABD3GD20_9MARC
MGRWSGILFCLIFSITAVNAYNLYKDPTQDVETRVQDLLKRMTLAEKIGQMTQIERLVANYSVIKDYYIVRVPEFRAHLNSKCCCYRQSSEVYLLQSELQTSDVASMEFEIIISGGGSAPEPKASVDTWQNMIDHLQAGAIDTRLQIPMIYAIDAVHGHNNVYGAVINPHNIGLGCTRDPDLVNRVGAATALEVRATGISYVFAPCIAVSSFTSSSKVVACAKHYLGDGGTTMGINENNTVIDYNDLVKIHMAQYFDAIRKGVSTIMVSYSSWNGMKMHANKFLVTKVLKYQLKFQGFVISDWEGIDRITSPPDANYTFSILAGINAGIDMVMVPMNYTFFIPELTRLVKEGYINMHRINDVVTRILRVKFTMGLFEMPWADRSYSDYLGAQEHRVLAREAVRKSLVLLKNGKEENHLLPLNKNASKIIVAGSHADDIGRQCGGWTITWQGSNGTITNGTTILEGIKSTVSPNTEVIYEPYPHPGFAESKEAEYAIVVIGEPPYAETFGDNLNLTIPEEGIATIQNVCTEVKCVVILISGRPLVIEPDISLTDAFVAAWLPGSEGNGIADVIFGDYDFQGTLSHTWFKRVDQLPMNVGDIHYDPLFPFGFGLKMNVSSSR